MQLMLTTRSASISARSPLRSTFDTAKRAQSRLYPPISPRPPPTTIIKPRANSPQTITTTTLSFPIPLQIIKLLLQAHRSAAAAAPL
ncbi:unnamed protein product [Anisakis simplex]|uniref:Uncharacterized protein n=1 Tax=Anisakis simplex TaxID=6269 RepID=A0A0M3JJN2_ANISI|nr:unnamed protein product [Anisakis simplex]